MLAHAGDNFIAEMPPRTLHDLAQDVIGDGPLIAAFVDNTTAVRDFTVKLRAPTRQHVRRHASADEEAGGEKCHAVGRSHAALPSLPKSRSASALHASAICCWPSRTMASARRRTSMSCPAIRAGKPPRK